MSMSNKFLALLILIFTLFGLFGLYFYFFVGYTSKLTIESNTTDYQVELYSKRIGKSFEYSCTESPCVLSDISPLEYSLRVRKDGYKTVYQDIDMPARESISIDINLIQEISLSEAIIPEQEISNKDRISYLRDKNRALQFFDLESWVYAYFSSGWELYLYRDESTEKIWDFSVSEDDELDVQLVSDTDYLYFQIWDTKYIYHVKSWKIETLSLWVDISYIKKWNDDNYLVFVTSVWAYTYDISSNTFEYFYLFKDFVYTDDNYIWVIYADEEKKLQNFDLVNTDSNLIIRYNPDTKNREVLYETLLQIDKIYMQDETVYFESEGKRYELENL